MTQHKSRWVITMGVVGLLVVTTVMAWNQGQTNMLGWFKKQVVHLSPPVSGQILKDGAPVADVLVTRELTYGNEYLDQARTDRDGRFRFPEKRIHSRIPSHPFDETRLRQVVVADLEDERYLLWYTVTGQTSHHPITLKRKLASLHCDLNDAEQIHNVQIHEHPDFEHVVHSICRWPD